MEPLDHHVLQKPYIVKAHDALSRGQLWRAKEILQGVIATSTYDPVLYEQYGLVLLRMGDLVEAGKYLFLSGRHESNYQESIDLYLKRFGRSNWQTLVASFPRRAKNIEVDLFPEAVQVELLRLEIPRHRGCELQARKNPKGQLSDTLGFIGCAFLCLFLLICCITGLVVIIYAISKI